MSTDGFRVLIVDDSGIYRRILAEAVEKAEAQAKITQAGNGLTALETLAAEPADACLLDVNMPGLDGIETLKKIKERYPGLPVIMVSGDSKDGASLTVQALGLGALDFILKPLDRDFESNLLILSRHLSALFEQIRRPRSTVSSSGPGRAGVLRAARNPDIVLIASSTGGPAALEKIIPRLGRDFPKPILVVQHMPPGFTKVFAESLNRKSRIEVAEAKDGDAVESGKVLIAPGGFHMKTEPVSGSGKAVRLEQSELVCGVRPSADVLFASAASCYETRNVLAVVLTGMGRDGAAGVAALKGKTGCHCITQSERTCVVYGMPRSICEAGLSDEVSDLEDIADRIEMTVLRELK